METIRAPKGADGAPVLRQDRDTQEWGNKLRQPDTTPALPGARRERTAPSVERPHREVVKNQRAVCVWLTGLSGAGKTTIATMAEKRLHEAGRHTYLLDGDRLRRGINQDLGFTDADRCENMRRVGEIASLMVDAGLIVLVSLISPFRAERQMVRSLFAPGEFVEVFVDTPMHECEARDPKGLYAKARRGELRAFTGIDSPYEPPLTPDLALRTSGAPEDSARELVQRVMQLTARREER